ncbi:glycoside hydrolase [Moorella thermoacetica]|uniref:Alpha-amylase/alpha-mannosidase n=2 Tax=Neomoorella thermoacetica TaxID=1525 RepID=A0A0S6UC67_NEOTH|nr:DUF3536 domain-containing protein [Moorella thermoacetica]AKX94621.1 glycosyl hydrolase family 57 [Moorella thermoacetica]AKX97257.1 glycosyl hydrolase family 57 [Moorella thermoacetica]OIQ57324.1 glycosyl hydrolase family 57 [Moorella thermoacetica]QDA01087.1 Glycosyl hydrolase family 57 [Moorella thermoacetica]TYL10244.1 hypothetical protein MOOCA_08470 [Moorella thermoacetica]
MERYICIHGHFYQPPRENPWLEDIELQDSAYPYHDWDERITAECYEPNTASRILDGDGWIRKIVNNYSKISFNFGPTLLSWMETNAPEVYRAIIEADRESQRRFSGHGSALAQAYNHMIMPLANTRDKYTQVIWGIKDFEHRFGRRPEGMWLPETAVDLETLAILAQQGIRFTILAHWQARRIRPLGSDNWQEVHGGLDTTMPYQVRLPNTDRTINVFFYNGEVARAVAFEKLLDNGERFAKRLLSVFNEGRNAPQLVNIATDGETYGHHHRHGDMALAYALDYIEANKLARLTNYGEYLEKHPPTHEVEINNNSSWSCAHGVERWRTNCGCNTGMHPGWSQAWRAPLRDSLNWLRNTLAPKFEGRARQFLKDPWAARNDYIAVILDRSPENFDRFLGQHATRILNQEEKITVLKLLELQRHAMLMFTSCGWFFDEISGIETVQVIKYAGRVIQLAQELFNESPEPRFMEMLAQAKSNIPEHRDGAHIYEKFVKPAMVDLLKVGAHYALCSLYETYDQHSRIFCYDVYREDYQNRLAGTARLAVGRAQVTSQITQESIKISYGAVTLGNHNVSGGVQVYTNDDSYQRMVQELTGAFDRADFNEVIRLLDQHFAGATYSLRQLFRDKQRMVLDIILESTLAEAAEDYRRIYDRHAPLMRFLKDLNIPQPRALQAAAEFVLNTSLRQAFAGDNLDLEHIKALLGEAEMAGVPLDGEGLGYVLEQTLKQMAEKLLGQPDDQVFIGRLDAVISLVRSLPFEVNLWKVQNAYYRLLQTVYPGYREKARQGDGEARAWLDLFNSLGDKLQVRRGKNG